MEESLRSPHSRKKGECVEYVTVIPRPVPEPYTVTGSLLALGFGWWTKRKQAVAFEKKPHKGIYL
ncbi:MAG: PEP-CTERM sorting domain-containing protein [Nostoc sp. JL33]|nr:PEP-CTERM sorting domain-containing protein [Nostoc sp. JL33]